MFPSQICVHSTDCHEQFTFVLITISRKKNHWKLMKRVECRKRYKKPKNEQRFFFQTGKKISKKVLFLWRNWNNCFRLWQSFQTYNFTEAGFFLEHAVKKIESKPNVKKTGAWTTVNSKCIHVKNQWKIHIHVNEVFLVVTWHWPFTTLNSFH